MPYRRLPNTNRARLRALSDVVKTGRKYDDLYALAFPYTLLEQASMLLPQYETKVKEFEQSKNTQLANSRKCSAESKMARMYISHFIQVLNMCVSRGEIKAECKKLYGLDPDDNTVPDIATDDHLAEWGNKIIEGERLRKQQGGSPIYNPPITKVSVYFDQFMDKYNVHRLLQNNTNRSSKSITEMNDQVDSLLLQIWNEIEEHFSPLPLKERLQRCCEYGIVYYYRAGERPEMGKVTAEEDFDEYVSYKK
ncbi:MAG: hypothetical protein MJZ24_08065 [Paludibacteraceae bacterium]|nr:hypothetical protein [Paludibacteraceae bacterium]